MCTGFPGFMIFMWGSSLCISGTNEHVRPKVLPGHKSYITATAVSERDKWAASAETGNNNVRLWDFAVGKETKVLPCPKKSYVSGLAFSPDERELTIACGSLLVRWDLAKLGESQTEQMPQITTAIAYSPNGLLLAAAVGTEVVVWEREGFRIKHRLFAHKTGVSRLAFSSDSGSIAASLLNWSIKIWSFDDTKQPKQLKGHEFLVSGLAFGTNDTALFSGSWDCKLTMWDVKTLEGKAVFNEMVTSVSASKDGKRLVASTLEGRLLLWDLKRNEKTAIFDLGEPINSVSLSSAGTRVLVGYGDQFRSPGHKANQGKLAVFDLKTEKGK